MTRLPRIRRIAAAVSRTAVLVALGVIAPGAIGGCRTAPIEFDGERSQFDRHDALQGDWNMAYTENEFGRRVPNLRARLLRR